MSRLLLLGLCRRHDMLITVDYPLNLLEGIFDSGWSGTPKTRIR